MIRSHAHRSLFGGETVVLCHKIGEPSSRLRRSFSMLSMKLSILIGLHRLENNVRLLCN